MAIRHLLLPTVLVALGSACGSPTQPSPVPPTLTIAGDQKSDTVDGTFPDTLVITVHDSTGRLAIHTTVELNSGVGFYAYVWMIPTRPPLPDLGVTGNISDTTDSKGQLKVRVKSNAIAGPTRIIIKVPGLGLIDSARYTVLVGGPKEVFSLPADTALQVGKGLTIKVRVIDRYGNDRPDPVTYQSNSSVVTLNGATVTAAAIGRIKVYARSGALADSTLISVVPPATFAASSESGVYLFESDLTGFRRLGAFGSLYTAWNPNGLEVLAARFDLPHMMAFALDGTGRQVVGDIPGIPALYAPQYSANGAFIYYTAQINTPPFGFQVWRANVDGSAPIALPNIPYPAAGFPSPSPDGNTLVYVDLSGAGTGVIHWYNLVTQQPLAFQVTGHSPHWSPDGQHIAFNQDGRIMLMNPDGSGVHEVTPAGSTWGLNISWSHDGLWLVVVGGRAALLQLSTGLVLPLAPITNVDINGLSWKP